MTRGKQTPSDPSDTRRRGGGGGEDGGGGGGGGGGDGRRIKANDLVMKMKTNRKIKDKRRTGKMVKEKIRGSKQELSER